MWPTDRLLDPHGSALVCAQGIPNSLSAWMVRQGDIALIAVSEIPDDAEPVAREWSTVERAAFRELGAEVASTCKHPRMQWPGPSV